MALPIIAKISQIAKSAKVKISTRPDKRFKRADVKWLKSDMKRLGEEIAEDFKDTIINNIETNRYGYSLEKSTIDRKGSDIPLIDSHTLVDSIYRKGSTVSVRNSPRNDSSLTNLELAIVHEYGTKDKHIPARPVWRQTFRDFRSTARDRIAEFLDNPKFKDNGQDNN